MNDRISTRSLCQILGTSHARFNAMVARGTFWWLSETATPKARRTWDADDILTLRLFQELYENQVFVHRAARIAGLVGGVARSHPSHSFIAYTEGEAGAPQAVAIDSLRDVMDMDMAHVSRMTIFQIAKHRAAIAKQIASLTCSEAA